MKKLLLILGLLPISFFISSQTADNPFKKLGYTPLMATLTRGEFEEFHDQTDIVEIGSVLYNTRTKEVVGFLDEGQTTLDVSSATIATSIDPLCEKYYWISPYAYVANNPIKFIDPTGMELMLFKNGVYVGSHDDGKKEVTGFNQRSTTNKDGTEQFTGADNFSFNDIELDRGALENGSMTLSFIGSDDVNSIIGQSGANDQSALSRWGYTARESNANNLSGSGKLDFRTYPQISDESHLYVVNSVGYNSADAGNYLWGYAMRTMGFTETAARSAAHLNAWYSAKQSNGEGSQSSWGIVRAFENRSWGGDSAADQRAIKNGMNDAGGYWKHKKQTLRRQWDRMRK